MGLKSGVVGVMVSLACWSCGAAPSPGESDDGNVAAKQEKDTRQDDIDAINKVIKPLADLASTVAAVYSGVGTVTAVLQTFGVISTNSQDAQFNALAQQITNLGSAFTWYLNASSVDETLRALDADLSTAQEQVEQNLQNPNNPSFPKFTTASAVYGLSAENTGELESDLHFLRYWDSSAYKTGSFAADWVNHIPMPSGEPFLGATVPGVSSGAGSSSFVYDWRLGLPAMMLAIATRVQMIAAADPGFSLESTRKELLQHSATLLSHYNRMVSGVQCATVDQITPSQDVYSTVTASEQLNVFCADTSTGSALAAADVGNMTFTAYGQHDPNDTTYKECCVYQGNTCFSHDPTCINTVDAMLTAGRAAAASKQTELYNAVMDGLPLYEMRDLMNTLYFYASRSQDITILQPRLQELGGGGTCLDVQSGSTAVGNPVWSWPCNGTVTQRWQYDRKTARILNPTSQLCLDAVPITGSQELAVQLANCSDTSQSQRWSYDPEQFRIYSGATSTGLLIGVPSNGTPITVNRQPACLPDQFCGNHTGEFWVADQPVYPMNRVWDPANDLLNSACVTTDNKAATLVSKCSTLSSTCGFLYCVAS